MRSTYTMNILWFTWKDRKHPQADGAEAVFSGQLYYYNVY